MLIQIPKLMKNTVLLKNRNIKCFVGISDIKCLNTLKDIKTYFKTNSSLN